MENVICTVMLLLFCLVSAYHLYSGLVSLPEDACLRAQVKSIMAGRKHETPVMGPCTCYAGSKVVSSVLALFGGAISSSAWIARLEAHPRLCSVEVCLAPPSPWTKGDGRMISCHSPKPSEDATRSN
jgi:hypothetical protein